MPKPAPLLVSSNVCDAVNSDNEINNNAYGNAYDMVFNITKSQVMFYDTLVKLRTLCLVILYLVLHKPTGI